MHLCMYIGNEVTMRIYEFSYIYKRICIFIHTQQCTRLKLYGASLNFIKLTRHVDII